MTIQPADIERIKRENPQADWPRDESVRFCNVCQQMVEDCVCTEEQRE